jgi:hypothetical protein
MTFDLDTLLFVVDGNLPSDDLTFAIGAFSGMVALVLWCLSLVPLDDK